MSRTLTDCVEDGARVVRYPGGHVKWRSDCEYCAALEAKGIAPVQGFFTHHEAMPGCRSGGRDHCTCDGCF